MADFIPPLTDGELRVTLLDLNDSPITGGTFTAEVYSPRGTHVATGQVMTYTGSNGIWKLLISDAWSLSAGKALEGEYVAVITGIYSGSNLSIKIRYVVRYDDDS